MRQELVVLIRKAPQRIRLWPVDQLFFILL